MLWRWAINLVDYLAPPKILGRGQFDRLARRNMSAGRGGPSALLFVEIDRLLDAERVLGRYTCEQLVGRLADLVITIASDCPVTRVTKDAFLVYVRDVPFSVNVADAIRTAAHREMERERCEVVRHYAQAQSPASLDEHVLTVSVGACTVARRQDFEDAVRRAEDALLEAKQAGGNLVLWSSAASFIANYRGPDNSG